MRYLVRTVPGREDFVSYLAARIPGLEVVVDQDRNAMNTFFAALDAAGNDAAIHLEDDIILTRDFTRKIDDAVWEHLDDVIQFFSMRAADHSVGSRWESGRTFSMNQCFHLPAGLSADLRDYARKWERFGEHPTGYDIMMADWLQSRKRRYWLYAPSLVQHRQCVSLIDRRRSRCRQSTTFTDGDL